MVDAYREEVNERRDSAEVGVGVGSVPLRRREEVRHNRRIVEHCRACHSKCNYTNKTIHFIDLLHCKRIIISFLSLYEVTEKVHPPHTYNINNAAASCQNRHIFTTFPSTYPSFSM